MKILIVHAHENPHSFCSALANLARSTFETKGHLVTISNLYQKKFNPIGGQHDFTTLSDSSYYKYALEQMNAQNNQSFAADIKTEMDLIADADVLIFNFPMWWFDLPAILKGWVDRVLAYGFAYGGNYGMGPYGRFKDRRAYLCITTRSPASFYTLDGAHRRTMDDILRNINEGILGLVGYKVLPPFVAYGVSRITDKERSNILSTYQDFLNEHIL